ncbi:MAG: hypothetical protein EBX71_06695, partial [Betaproteobacteria bacterium]|nr:hypothetical protein [Betaproteobacteria bacterium]
GSLMVAQEQAALFADSRYWVQADQELQGSGIDLEKVQSATPAVLCEWMLKHLPPKATVAVDGAVLALSSAKLLRERMLELGFSLRTDLDLLQDCWPERAGLPQAAIYEHLAPQASRTRREKLALIRDAMHRLGASRMLEFLVYAFFTSKSHNQDGLSRRAQASRPRQLGAGKMAQAKRQER